MATTDKYDRQLRLWGAGGQRALGNTLVVLIGTSACGTETLKNLVLPGVGSILVVNDDDDVSFVGDRQPTVVCPSLTESLMKFASPNSNFFLPPRCHTVEDDEDDEEEDDNGDDGRLRLTHSTTSHASRACTLLCELNPDVLGHHLTVPSLLGVDFPSFLASLTVNPSPHPLMMSQSSSSVRKILVVAADQPSTVLLPLSRACYLHSIPLIVVRSYGLIGTVRVQTPAPYHPIIESRPSHRLPDLRLSSWPVFDGLRDVVASVPNLDDVIDTKDRSHVPFVVILLQALDKWRCNSSGDNNDGGSPTGGDADPTSVVQRRRRLPLYPTTVADKDAFRVIVRKMANNLNNELNFEEALREAYLVWSDGRISDDVRMVLERVDETSFLRAAIKSDMDIEGGGGLEIPSHVLQFQLLVLALKRFLITNEDYPPLEGTVPDMISDTARHVALQEAYRRQAEKDRHAICEIVKSLLEECERRSNGCDLRVTMPTDDEISTFCKNARYLRILETRPLFAEYVLQDRASPTVATIAETVKFPSSEEKSSNFDAIQSNAWDDLLSSTMDPYETDPVQTPLLWWIALRACDAFYDRHQHYPGKHDQELALEADANEVYGCMVQIVSSMGLAESDLLKKHLLDKAKGRDLAREVVRYDEAEIHNIAAIVGGVASQEAVKLITGQYVPIDDTYVYNGIASTAGVYRF